MARLILFLFVVLALALPAPAQQTVIGIGNVPCMPPTPPGLAVLPICQPPPTWCMTPQLPPFAAPFAGGTEWDDILQGAWVSDGTMLAVYAPAPGGCPVPCKLLCGPFPWPMKSLVTGLAMDVYRRTLYVCDNLGIVYTFAVLAPCQLQLRAQCPFPMPGAQTILTGLAFDIFSNSLFLVSATGAPGADILYISPAGNPCQPYCKFPIPACPGAVFGPALGLAYDACKREVLVTDGPQVMTLKWFPPCQFRPVACCPAGPVAFQGLALMQSAAPPGLGIAGNTSTTWFPCQGHGCPNCPTAAGFAGGLPQIGNPAFALQLTQAPSPPAFLHFALLLLNLGNRCKAQKIAFPCGAVVLYPVIDPLYMSFLVPALAAGPGACTLAATFPLPIPINPNLCGFAFCGQWAVFNVNPGSPGPNWCLTLSQQFNVTIGA